MAIIPISTINFLVTIFATLLVRIHAAGNQHTLESWSFVTINRGNLVIFKQQEQKECNILAF